MNYKNIARRLVAWHLAHQRELPWRTAPAGSREPYMVWVSEIMAQQTRLVTVCDYFERWMQVFPTVEALAAADQQSVLKQWEGLGYYARARNLHRAARIVVEEHGGVVPADRELLLTLPGIGEYTAGAILSLAFGQSEPVLDGNVKRVLSRLTDEERSFDTTEVQKALWATARALVSAADEGQAGWVNEGLMELGATLCATSAPRCMLCPLQTECRALRVGTQEARPVRQARRKIPHYDVAAGVIWRGLPFASPLLIAQRPEDGMLGGMWEFPGGKLEEVDADLHACLLREIEEELAIQIEVGASVTTVDHAYTHFRITLYAFHAQHIAGEPESIGCADWRWVELDELAQYPFPVTDQQIIRVLHTQAEVWQA